MKTLVTVTIPVYSERPTATEIASLKQCTVMLGNHPIVLFVPRGLSLSNYDLTHPTISVIEVDPIHLSSREHYSAYMLQQNFYQLFIDSEYILIYQLDAWVFRDELAEWCSRGYHYIGAPWVRNRSGELVIIGVGNGGFSLRHVNKSIEVLDVVESYRSDPDRANEFINSVTLDSLRTITKSFIQYNPYDITSIGKFTDAENGKCLYPEDGYWANVASIFVSDFIIPAPDIAWKFSMEGEAPTLYERNNNSLPFGCHAWMHCTPEFWYPHIKFDINTMTQKNKESDNIETIFYKNGDSTSSHIATIINEKYPHINLKSCDMHDLFQIVNKNNIVMQGDKATVIVNSLIAI